MARVSWGLHMARSRDAEGLGALLAFVVVGTAVVIAVLTVLAAGAVGGSWVGLSNYVKSFRSHVRFQRPGEL
jgi:hypothetical protein